MGREPRRLSSIEPRRGATSRARAGCEFVSSRLLATIALVAAVSAPAQAQVQTWVDATGNWIIGTNWAPAGTPTPATDAQIDNGGTAQITGPASANSLTLGSIPGGSGTVTIGAGGLGILKTTTGLVGSQSGSQGAVDVSGAIASWTNTGTLVVGSSGTGTLTIQNRGTVTDGAGFIGNLPGGLGTVMVTGAGSSWSNAGSVVVGGLGTGTLTIQDGGTVNSGGGGSVGLSAGSTGTVTVTGPGSTWNNSPGGGLNIGSFGTGTLTIANGGMVNNNTAFTANIGNGAGSQGTVTVTGAGSIWSNSSGVNVGNLGAGTLTIADSGVVAGPVTIATNAGSIGTLNIGAGAGNPAAAPGTLTASSIAFGAGTGTINFNHTSTSYVFAPAITGNGTVNVLAGTTTLTGANTYSGATNVNAGTLRAGVPNTFSPNSPVTIASGGTLDLNGFSQTVPSVTNAGLVNMGTGTAPGTLLTTTNYVGAGGTIAMNTFLGGDGSPSDKLVINGGTASGNSFLRITNAGGPGAITTGNGILVVDATNGTTAPGAFALAGPVVAGPFEYKLFRGAPDPVADSWFLRSTIDCAAPGATSPPCPPAGSGAAPPNFRIETSLYAAIPSLALLYGRNLLDTLHERVGEKEDQRSATGSTNMATGPKAGAASSACTASTMAMGSASSAMARTSATTSSASRPGVTSIAGKAPMVRATRPGSILLMALRRRASRISTATPATTTSRATPWRLLDAFRLARLVYRRRRARHLLRRAQHGQSRHSRTHHARPRLRRLAGRRLSVPLCRWLLHRAAGATRLSARRSVQFVRHRRQRPLRRCGLACWPHRRALRPHLGTGRRAEPAADHCLVAAEFLVRVPRQPEN